MPNYLTQSRKKWRKLGYYVEGTESILRLPGGITTRKDLFGFVDLIAFSFHSSLPWIYLQVTGWTNVSTRFRKIQREQTGRGQWATDMRQIAALILERGDNILIEGWRLGKNGRYEEKTREVMLRDLEGEV